MSGWLCSLALEAAEEILRGISPRSHKRISKLRQLASASHASHLLRRGAVARLRSCPTQPGLPQYNNDAWVRALSVREFWVLQIDSQALCLRMKRLFPPAEFNVLLFFFLSFFPCLGRESEFCSPKWSWLVSQGLKKKRPTSKEGMYALRMLCRAPQPGQLRQGRGKKNQRLTAGALKILDLAFCFHTYARRACFEYVIPPDSFSIKYFS